VKASRPTDKEINRKLSVARKAAADKCYFLLSPAEVYDDLDELELITDEDFQRGLHTALSEITVKDYAGSYPPMKSYEPVIKDKELFAFCWESSYFKRRIYLKFAVLAEEICIVSFHTSRPSTLKGKN
jgi:hypothetical protein